jgi:hypothetical protein
MDHQIVKNPQCLRCTAPSQDSNGEDSGFRRAFRVHGNALGKSHRCRGTGVERGSQCESDNGLVGVGQAERESLGLMLGGLEHQLDSLSPDAGVGVDGVLGG